MKIKITRRRLILLGASALLAFVLAVLVKTIKRLRAAAQKASLRTAPAEDRVLSDENFPKDFPTARFPSGFMWGAAASGYQVGSIGRASDWWEWERNHDRTRLNEPPDDYHVLRWYERDYAAAKEIGLTHYRLSIDWSLIEPEEGKWDKQEIAHYQRQILNLKRRGIEPMVCLNHFVLPKWAADRGGWTNPETAVLFGRYVEKVAITLGKPLKIKLWLTFNEPTVPVIDGYIKGEYPPGKKYDWASAYFAFRNLARAHKIAYRALHGVLDDQRGKISVGIAGMVDSYLASPEPLDPGVMEYHPHANIYITQLVNFALNKYFIEVTEDFHDFVGINYYKEYTLKLNIWSRWFLSEYKRGEISPGGLYRVIKDYAVYGKPIIITENGINTEDERMRIKFIAAHLLAIRKAMDGGADVRGYFYWSLTDTYEWNEGYSAHFGLADINRQTQERTPRQSACFLKDIIKENGFAPELLRKHLKIPENKTP